DEFEDQLTDKMIFEKERKLKHLLATDPNYKDSEIVYTDQSWDDQSQREFLQIISGETDRLSALVSDLLDLSRIEAGDINVSRSACDFEGLIHRASQRAHPQPGDRLRLEITSVLPELELDVRRIEVVMRNLIENATKYAGQDSPIRVCVNLSNGILVVKVEDEGPGIPDDESARIFESFYRLEGDTTHTTPGLGLGLSICQGFIKAHGGEIWTEPRETGACIAFSIPINS
ncbi:MAG: ATP-binding protein, partial [Anaerolineales bacterium]|nr:ATP-binding protein [Anaerolineales bacterium]